MTLKKQLEDKISNFQDTVGDLAASNNMELLEKRLNRFFNKTKKKALDNPQDTALIAGGLTCAFCLFPLEVLLTVCVSALVFMALSFKQPTFVDKIENAFSM